jgi:uncharacterized membrane protein YphA (DoxX/SURF4 family)
MNAILMLCQAIVGLGLLNVWLLRSGQPTSFRGGNSTTLKEEFAVYGLPGWMFWTVGILKVGAAIALLAGFFLPELVIPAALLLAFLMLGAVVMHAKVKDPAKKWLPAISVLALTLVLAFGGS